MHAGKDREKFFFLGGIQNNITLLIEAQANYY